MAKIGRNIREQRMKKGLSQEELAEKLYVTRQTISNYETGKSNPDVEMLARIAEELDIDIQLLIYGETKKRDMKQIRTAAASLVVILLLYVYFQKLPGMRRWRPGPGLRCRASAVYEIYRVSGPVSVGRQCGDFLDHGTDRRHRAFFRPKKPCSQGSSRYPLPAVCFLWPLFLSRML